MVINSFLHKRACTAPCRILHERYVESFMSVSCAFSCGTVAATARSLDTSLPGTVVRKHRTSVADNRMNLVCGVHVFSLAALLPMEYARRRCVAPGAVVSFLDSENEAFALAELD